MMSHFKVIVNPRDELAWNRILMLIEGIGPVTAERISSDILVLSNLNDVLEKVFPNYNRGYKYSDELKKLEVALKTVNNKNMAVGEQFEVILEYYEPLLEDKYDDWNIFLSLGYFDSIEVEMIMSPYWHVGDTGLRQGGIEHEINPA